MTNNNPYHDLLRKVWKMRKAQKDDAKYHSRATKSARENAEREVDKILDAVTNQSAKVKQMGMLLEDSKQEAVDVSETR